MKPALTDCPKCLGKGVLPNAKRRMENGEPDPADFREFELCDRCGGGGLVRADVSGEAARIQG